MSKGSRMLCARTQHCSSEPYRSQFTRYSSLPSHLQEVRMDLLMKVGWLSISKDLGGVVGRLLEARGCEMTGLRQNT